MRYRLLLFILLSSEVFSQDTASEFHEFLRQAFEDELKEQPSLASSFGHRELAGRWRDLSPEAIELRKVLLQKLQADLKRFHRAQLGETDRFYYDVFTYDVERRVEAARYPSELLAIDQLFNGPQITIPGVLRRQPTRTTQDYETQLELLRAAPRFVDQSIALLQQGVRQRITQPAIVLRELPAQIDKLTSGSPQKSAFMTAFNNFPASMPEAERQRLYKEAAAIVDGSVFPAFRRLRNYLADEYIPKSRASIALGALPNGASWYAFNARLYTTTKTTPEEIHQLGLREVNRIRAEMDTIRKEAGFKGDHAQFLNFLRTAPQFYYTKPEELLTSYRDLCKRIDPELPRLFGKLPRTPYGVIATPDHIAPSDTSARYIRSSADGVRPGYFQVNTYKLNSRPKYEMEALALHESVPGHHLQLALAIEREETPPMIRILDAIAFSEGWGLYAESLGEELGLYQDPYSRFGARSFEIWRASRLVVDTGMHALGWSRQQAIEYMLENTAATEQNVIAEVDRYIAWPGQALAYKIGELKIKELRARAEKELGRQFNIRDFHDTVLSNGALPLELLEAQIDRFIKLKGTDR